MVPRALALTLLLAACGSARNGVGTSSSTQAASTAAPSATTTARPTTTTSRVPTTTAPATTTVASVPTTSGGGAAQRVWRGDTTRAQVAFTFDAGSDAGYTTAILDLLAADHIHASFGITGNWARANPALVRRIVADGHQLINHTDSHRSFTGRSTGTAALSSDERVAQVLGAERSVAAITGVNMRPYFRPPYGDIDSATDVDVARAGYRYDVLWTVDSLGWKGMPAAAVADRCLVGAGNGVIYLFHVGSQSTDAAALPAIIAGLHARGLAIGTVAAAL